MEINGTQKFASYVFNILKRIGGNRGRIFIEDLIETDPLNFEGFIENGFSLYELLTKSAERSVRTWKYRVSVDGSVCRG
jgi:hypothetical protein